MTAISRRELMCRAAACSGAALLLSAHAAYLQANPLDLPIGSQVYPLRSMLKDLPAFARQMAEIGVTRLELCSPIGYGADFASLKSGHEVKKILADHGLTCRELSLQHARATKEPAKEHRMGQGSRHHADDHRDSGRR